MEFQAQTINQRRMLLEQRAVEFSEASNGTTPNVAMNLGTGNLDYLSMQGIYNMAYICKSNNVASDVLGKDGSSRVITYKDGSTTEFYYNANNKTLETYDKKLNSKGELEIACYTKNTGVNANVISDDDAIAKLHSTPTCTVENAKNYAENSGLQFNNIEEFKNVANIQTDYDSQGNPSCLILLDAAGNSLGHMWTQAQNNYTIDNKIGELVIYNSGKRYQCQANGSFVNI